MNYAIQHSAKMSVRQRVMSQYRPVA